MDARHKAGHDVFLSPSALHLPRVQIEWHSLQIAEGTIVPIPDFQTLMLPVLQLAAHGEVRISDAVERLANEFHLSPEERSNLLPSGRQTTFANRVHWAKSYLGKAGLIELTRRAHFRITKRGSEVLASPPERIDIRFLSQFPEFLKSRESETSDDAQAESVAAQISEAILAPDEVMREAHRQLEVALADDLLQRMRASTPAFFESLVVRLLVAMGYGGSVVDVEKAIVGGSGDNGIDGVIDQDPLGLDRILFKQSDTLMEIASGQQPLETSLAAWTDSRPIRAYS